MANCGLKDWKNKVSDELLKNKIEHYKRETGCLKHMLNKHQQKWGMKI